MRRAIRLAALAWAIPSLAAETGSFTIHMILHAIGEERYEIAQESGGLALKSSSEYSDRGMKRTSEASLRMMSDYTPLGFDAATPARKVAVTGTKATVQENSDSRTADLPARYFTIFDLAIRHANGDDALLAGARQARAIASVADER